MTTATLLTIAAITTVGYGVQVIFDTWQEQLRMTRHRRMVAERERQRQLRIKRMEDKVFKDPRAQVWSTEAQFLAEVKKRASQPSHDDND